MEELIRMVSERTGIAPDKAQQAVETVFSYLKAKLPPSIANHLDAIATGNLETIASSLGGMSGIADMAKSIEGTLGFGSPHPGEPHPDENRA
jgi:hypothetical protein